MSATKEWAIQIEQAFDEFEQALQEATRKAAALADLIYKDEELMAKLGPDAVWELQQAAQALQSETAPLLAAR